MEQSVKGQWMEFMDRKKILRVDHNVTKHVIAPTKKFT